MKKLATFSESESPNEEEKFGMWHIWLDEVDIDADELRYIWALEEKDDPTLLFMRHNKEPHGMGEYEYLDRTWGFVSPGGAVVTKWRQQPPFAPQIDMAQLSENAREMFKDIAPVPTTPPLLFSDFTGIHMEPPEYGDKEEVGLLDSKIGQFLLASVIMAGIMAITLIMLQD